MATQNNSVRRINGPFFIGNKPVGAVFGNYVASGLLVRANTGLTPITVTVESGVAVVDGLEMHVYQETYGLVAADGSNPRKDLVQVGPGTIKKITVKPGEAATTPTAPAPDAGCIPLAIINVAAGVTTLSYWDAQNDVRPVFASPRNW